MTRGVTAVEGALATPGTLIAYLMAGYPDRERSIESILAAIEGGAGMIEVGVPFSDPVADGPVIAAAGYRSLEQGTTLAGVLEMVRCIRTSTDAPLVLMTYLNPIRRMGVVSFAEAAQQAGVDGIIVPDLIPDEAWDLVEACHLRSLATIFLAAPNSSEERLRRIARLSTGFIYAVGLEGVTGERDRVSDGLAPFVARIRAAAAAVGKETTKVAVGFGVSRAEHYRAIAAMADGVIVGSAIVRRQGDAPAAVKEFVRQLKAKG